MGIANDPGLGNRYLFTEGCYKGRVGLWSGAGETGVHIEWEGGGSEIVPSSEMDNARIALPEEKSVLKTLTPCKQCKGRGRWGPGPRDHCISCRGTGYREGAVAGNSLPKAPTYGWAPVG